MKECFPSIPMNRRPTNKVSTKMIAKSIILLTLLSGCATLEDRSITGQAADSISTVVALHDGFVESNGLIAGNLPIVLIAKPVLAYATKYLDHPDCVVAKRWLGGLGWGLFGWNILLDAGIPGAGIVAGVAGAIYGQNESAAEAACIAARGG